MRMRLFVCDFCEIIAKKEDLLFSGIKPATSDWLLWNECAGLGGVVVTASFPLCDSRYLWAMHLLVPLFDE